MLIPNYAVYIWDALRAAGEKEYWCGQLLVDDHTNVHTPFAAYDKVGRRIGDDIGLPQLVGWKGMYRDFIAPSDLTADKMTKVRSLICWRVFWSDALWSTYPPIKTMYRMEFLGKLDFEIHLEHLGLSKFRSKDLAAKMNCIMLMEIIKATYVHVYHIICANPERRISVEEFIYTPMPVVLVTREGDSAQMEWIHQKAISVEGRRIFC